MTGTGYDCTTIAGTCVAQGPLAAGADGPAITLTAQIKAGFTGTAKNVAYVQPAADDVAETLPLQPNGDPVPTVATDTAGTDTDNDDQAELTVSKVSVGDYVWADDNRNDVQDDTEAGVAGVTVILYAADGTTEIKQTTTNADGFYSFTDLAPSTDYVVEFVKPAGTSFTEANQGGDDGLDSDVDPAVNGGKVSIASPATGANSASIPDDPTIDAGLVSNRVIQVEKQSLNCDVGQATCALAGAEYALFDTDPTVAGAVPIAGGISVDAANGALFNSTLLPLGNYWLVETKAPAGFELLAAPVSFSLTKNGITLTPSESSALVTVKAGDTFTIVISDAPASDLPKADGNGTWPFAVGGFLLLILAGAYIKKTSGLRFAPRRVS